jgi:hypothetical protein
MTARPPKLVLRMRSAVIAAALLAATGASVGAPAQYRPVQTADDGPSPPAKSGPPGPSYLEPLYATETTVILGKAVVGSNGEKLGLITDVVVDRDGRTRAAVIDFGGFLGVGSRKVAIDWRLLRFDT